MGFKLPLPGDVYFYTEIPIGVCIGPWFFGMLIVGLLVITLLAYAPEPLQLAIVLIGGWLLAKLWVFVVRHGEVIGIICIALLFVGLVILALSNLPAWTGVPPPPPQTNPAGFPGGFQVPPITPPPPPFPGQGTVPPIQPTRQTTYQWHGCKSLAIAKDIVVRNRWLVGPSNPKGVWLTDSFAYAKRHAGLNGYVVKVAVSPNVQLTNQGRNIWHAAIPNAKRNGQYYRVNGVTPVAVFNRRQKQVYP